MATEREILTRQSVLQLLQAQLPLPMTQTHLETNVRKIDPATTAIEVGLALATLSRTGYVARVAPTPLSPVAWVLTPKGEEALGG